MTDWKASIAGIESVRFLELGDVIKVLGDPEAVGLTIVRFPAHLCTSSTAPWTEGMFQ